MSDNNDKKIAGEDPKVIAAAGVMLVVFALWYFPSHSFGCSKASPEELKARQEQAATDYRKDIKTISDFKKAQEQVNADVEAEGRK